MAISLTAASTTLGGKQYEPILEELLFENKTVGEELVAFADDVKADTLITEVSTTVAMQAYTSGAPASSGTLTSVDTAITPVKVMYYQEFDPNTLRASRYGKTMKKGAWNTASSEFEKVVLGLYGREVSYDAEAKWWSNALAATKVAVAAGGNTAAEKAYVAGLTAGQFDGILTRIIWNNAAVGGRVNVVGTTIDATNVLTEYNKLYAAVPSLVLGHKAERPRIYAPYSHIQFINAYNNSATATKDVFVTSGVGTPNQSVSFQGIEIVFVPMPENQMVCALPSSLIWATDLVNDINQMKIDYIAANRDDMFVKHVFTIFAHPVRQATITHYL